MWQESQENEKTTSASPSEIIQSNHGKPNAFSSQRSHLDMKFSRFLDNRPSIYGQVYESLAVSNAVELFKLVFLSTATSPEAPNLLADILRHYSEHDLLAAFNYLREKKIMVNCSVTSPVVCINGIIGDVDGLCARVDLTLLLALDLHSTHDIIYCLYNA